jgi:hypothetical protein
MYFFNTMAKQKIEAKNNIKFYYIEYQYNK